MKKISDFFIWKLLDFDGEIFNIFEYACFRNGKICARSGSSECSQHILVSKYIISQRIFCDNDGIPDL